MSRRCSIATPGWLRLGLGQNAAGRRVRIKASYLNGGHPFPDRTHLSVLFATFQIEMFKGIERWIEFARTGIDQWPTTTNLGMTQRTETITRLLAHDQSALDD